MATRVAVCGAAGRMGKAILGICEKEDGIQVTAAIEHTDHPKLNQDSGYIAGIQENNVPITADISSVLDSFDVAIDFTSPQATISTLHHCVNSGKRMIIGTTGLDDAEQAIIKSASKEIGIVFAPNMSIGVNVCFKLTELAAETIGDSADVEIIEAHHRMKKDAPSGTAVHLGEIVAKKLGRDFKQSAVYGREGIIGERDGGTIGFETIRAGDIVGEHTVMFATSGERIEITHKASSRNTFAIGAVRAAGWIVDKNKGLYDMQDVLSLK